MAMHGVNTEYDSAKNPMLYMHATASDGWDWYQVFREPDDVLCIIYAKGDEGERTLPKWIEIA